MKKHLRTSLAAFSVLALAAVGCETEGDTTIEDPITDPDTGTDTGTEPGNDLEDDGVGEDQAPMEDDADGTVDDN